MTPVELQAQLRALTAHLNSKTPSRTFIATKLNELVNTLTNPTMLKQAGEEKRVGEHVRIRWHSEGETIYVEELPAKGLKKLRKGSYTSFASRRYNPLLLINIINFANISKSDSYETVKNKLIKSGEEAAARVEEELLKTQKNIPSSLEPQWSEDLVHYLEIAPATAEPIEFEGPDFHVTSTWNKFKLYKDDGHSIIFSKTNAGARKFYQMALAEGSLIATMDYAKLMDWLKAKKVPVSYYDPNHD